MKDVKIILKTVSDLSGLTKLHKKITDAVPAIGKLETGFKKAGTALKSMGDVGVKALGAMAKGSLVLTAAVAGSVREFAKFNVGMARAWTMMDVGKKQFKEIRSQVVDLSVELGVAKDELSSGLYQALSAGVPQGGVIDFLRLAADVARTDGSAVEVAVDGITTALNAFGKDVSEAEDVVGRMFGTVRGGKTTFGELAQSLAQAAPVASSMGVSLEEVLAATEAMTKQGIPTSTAFIYIRNALNGLNKELGDGWGEAQTFQEALEGLANSKNYSGNAMGKIFGSESMAGINALTGRNFQSAMDSLQKGGEGFKVFQEASEKVSSETSHWPRIWASIRAYVNDIGEQFDTKLRPTITTLVEKMESFRKGDNFEAMAEGLANAAVGFVNKILAGVMTAGDIIKKAWTNGPTAMAETLKAVITEAITLGATALIEFLRANINFFMTIGKVIGGALRTELLKLDLPGINDDKRRQEAAAEAMQKMTYQDLVDQGILSDAYLGAGGIDGSSKVSAEAAQTMAANLSGNKEKLSRLGGSTGGSEIMNALEEGRSNFAGSVSRLGNQFTTSLGNVRSAGSNALGLDVGGIYRGHYNQLSGITAPASQQTAVAAPSGLSEADLMTTLQGRLAMEQNDIAQGARMGADPAGTFMQKQRSDAAAVEQAIEQVQAGQTEYTKTLLASLQKLKDEQKTLTEQLRNLPL